MGDELTQACTLAVDNDEFEDVVPKKEGWAILKSLNPAYVDFQLVEDLSTFGRAPSSTFHFNDKNISGTHCTIKKESGNDGGPVIAFIIDQSTNGTFLDGMKIGKGNRFLLTSGQEIALVSKKGSTDKISFIYQAIEKDEEVEGGPQKKYLIGETLGAGNFATVKLAVDRKTGDKYAVKIIDKKKYFMNSSSRKDALMDEVNILKTLNHPNIIHIQEVFNTEKTLYLVLELVECGELLNDILSNENKCYDEPKAKIIFKQIVNGVSYLHNGGVAHRDLKPENILLKHRNLHLMDAVKLSDFGLSRSVNNGSFMKTMCGTPQYLAPEILTNGSNGAHGYGKEVDCWSLGAILYMMLCGNPPFEERGDISIFEQIRNAVFEFPESKFAHISNEAKDLIKRLLNVNPIKRYTCQQIISHPWYNNNISLDSLIHQDQVEKQQQQQQQQQQHDPMVEDHRLFKNVTMSDIDVKKSVGGSMLLGKRKSDESICLDNNNSNDSNNSNNNNLQQQQQPIPLNHSSSNMGSVVIKKSKSNESSPMISGSHNSTMMSSYSNHNISLGSNTSTVKDDSDTDDETTNLPPHHVFKQKTSSSGSFMSITPQSSTIQSIPTSPQHSNNIDPLFNVPSSPSIKSTNNSSSNHNNTPKKQQQQQQQPFDDSHLPMCMYGVDCYRKNPSHFKEYRHPPKQNKN
ncbi:hypothetical protein CYY_003414 [Polysphondylium violaceum]|uniref:non-specific serine/threonine protein kinase n=1 Tax=Polysphondylium violaceum TaxID=133409 RepID=A0A8J4V081_9MYCE|nr:hypothetical protein CYY_003414 [Polysphondylium violaceum]